MSDPTRPSSQQLSTWIGISIVVASALPVFLSATLAVEIRRDFALSDPALGLAAGLSYAVAMLCSSAAGRLVDALGAARSLHLAIALAFASLIGIALLVDSAAMLIGALVLAGLANAVASPGASALTSRRIAPDRQGVTLGVQQAGAPAGALLAGLALPALAVPLGWRWSFAAAALVPVAVGVMLHGVHDAVEVDGRRRVRRRAQLRSVRLLALAAGLANTAAHGMVAFLVIYAVETGLSAGAAGSLLAVVGCAAGLGRIAFGALADARGGNALAPVAVLMLVGATGYPLLATGHPLGVVAGALVAGGLGWSWAGLMTLAIVGSHRDTPGAAVGMGMTGIYAGASIGPFAIGLLADVASFAAAWLTAGGLALLASGIVVLADRMRAAQAPSAPGEARRPAARQ